MPSADQKVGLQVRPAKTVTIPSLIGHPASVDVKQHKIQKTVTIITYVYFEVLTLNM